MLQLLCFCISVNAMVADFWNLRLLSGLNETVVPSTALVRFEREGSLLVVGHLVFRLSVPFLNFVRELQLRHVIRGLLRRFSAVTGDDRRNYHLRIALSWLEWIGKEC